MEDMDGEDIAAAMGFSSFGGTRKRKHDQTKSPKPKADASGANTTRLGQRSNKEAHVPQDHLCVTIDPEASAPASGTHGVPIHVEVEQNQKQPSATGLAAFLSRGQRLAERPNATGGHHAVESMHQDQSHASMMRSFGGPAISQAELAALRNGVPDEHGDKAYFLPSFVENPWEPLRR